MASTSPTSAGSPTRTCRSRWNPTTRRSGARAADGLPAETLTLFGAEDIVLRRAQIDEGAAPEDRKAADHARLNALLGLAETAACRRRALLGYFGERRETSCDACDNCLQPPETFDATTPARMALSAALRVEEWFGAGHLIDILLGADTEKVRARGHAALPTFGVGREWDRRQWQAIFRQLQGLDFLRPDPSRRGALRLTQAARPVLRGEATVTLRRDALPVKGARTRDARAEPQALVQEEDQGLLSALKALRLSLARAQDVPAYVVFTDKTLIEMAERKPTTLDALAQIGGVGAKKLDTYGRAFLEAIRGAPPAGRPPRPPRARRPRRGRRLRPPCRRPATARLRRGRHRQAALLHGLPAPSRRRAPAAGHGGPGAPPRAAEGRAVRSGVPRGAGE
jgi:ATP-dependent DNA helicase RecQ